MKDFFFFLISMYSIQNIYADEREKTNKLIECGKYTSIIFKHNIYYNMNFIIINKISKNTYI